MEKIHVKNRLDNETSPNKLLLLPQMTTHTANTATPPATPATGSTIPDNWP
ncbi:MAG: hypothetical protein K6U80_16645 [Firmicutes bacterium]|nr:hypothetical protein [Bacillota bacterium]